SGQATGARAGALRAALLLAEPFYRAAMRARNRLFDVGLRKSHKLPRPVISIGNITTGGTGKTPMVRWLAERLRDEGRRVAILSRGYGSKARELGDELTMLDGMLNSGEHASVVVRANPDRVAAANELLRQHPEVDVFILDDGFQHRRVARDLDVVLINAASPFGFGHVLPRGMLREPLAGLSRAGAIVLTHADRVSADELSRIEQTIRAHNPHAPVYRACHAHTGLRSLDASSPQRSIDELARTAFFAFAGIGSPDLLDAQLRAYGPTYVGHRWFADHHRYTESELFELRQAAQSAHARMLLTTEKDWAKISSLPSAAAGLPIWRIDMALQFADDHEHRLLEQIHQTARPR
ncbi:MAG TPA: tetraacyldisaccharide 4'-kinase, partial [Tepidisphaeraceae bacterium]|nr:tetraacyldisaccharide 4'-kinase [Tepidisphaeraceae bacterium]